MRAWLAITVRAVRKEEIVCLIDFGFLRLVGIVLNRDSAAIGFSRLGITILAQFADNRHLGIAETRQEQGEHREETHGRENFHSEPLLIKESVRYRMNVVPQFC